MAEILDSAVDSIETATTAAGSKVKESLDKAVAAVTDSDAAKRIAVGKKTGGAKKQPGTTNKATAKVAKKQSPVTVKKVTPVKKVAKKQAPVTVKKVTPVKKVAKKQAPVTVTKVTPTKKATKKQVPVSKKQATPTKKAVKKQAPTTSKKASGTKKAAQKRTPGA